MVSKVFTNARKVDQQWYIVPLQFVGWANAREGQDLGSVEGTTGNNYFSACIDGTLVGDSPGLPAWVGTVKTAR